MFVRPWNEESEKILKQLSSNNGKAWTKNTKLGSEFGKRHKELFNNGFLEVASTRYSKRPDKTFFITPPDVMVIPRPHQRGISFHFKRFKIL